MIEINCGKANLEDAMLLREQNSKNLEGNKFNGFDIYLKNEKEEKWIGRISPCGMQLNDKIPEILVLSQKEYHSDILFYHYRAYIFLVDYLLNIKKCDGVLCKIPSDFDIKFYLNKDFIINHDFCDNEVIKAEMFNQECGEYVKQIKSTINNSLNVDEIQEQDQNKKNKLILCHLS
jgi:hypothetical protein